MDPNQPDQNAPQDSGNAPQNEPVSEPPAEGGEGHNAGPIVGIIVVVVLIIVGGFYMWNLQRDTSPEDQIDVAGDTIVQELTDQETSDAVSSIEADLDDTELDNIDAELSDLEADLNI